MPGHLEGELLARLSRQLDWGSPMTAKNEVVM
jgi:hypothetical protein